jgi:catechol 2,3-dioxygenase-like lactoylglutathione lyase family enzyme
MISGAHVIIYSKNAEADRAFFRDVFGFKSVDAGHGWLVFALPPAEAAFHPSENDVHELYFLCDDLKTEMASLAMKDRGSSMGFHYEDAASRWRRGRPLSTETSHGLGRRLEMKRRQIWTLPLPGRSKLADFPFSTG